MNYDAIKLLNIELFASASNQAISDLINKQLPLIKSIADAKHDDLIATQKINLAFMAASRGATPLQKERLNLEKQLLTSNGLFNIGV